MSGKESSVAPKERINVTFKPSNGEGLDELELPLKLMMMGDYTLKADDRKIEDRKAININKNNFNDVLAKFSPVVNLSVKNTLADDDRKDDINLTFKNIRDFEPEQVARNIPQLRVLLAMRNLLRDLKSNLLDNAAFRRELETILKDPALSQELRDELATMMPEEI